MPEVQEMISGHVNLMIDTVISNMELSDLRASLRRLVAQSPSNVTVFVDDIKDRIRRRGTYVADVPVFAIADGRLEPTQALARLLSEVRVHYGCGLGFESLGILRQIISELTDSLSNQPQGVTLSEETKNVLAAMDSDISQAAQACTEILSSSGAFGGYSSNTFHNKARSEVEALTEALRLLEEVSKDLEIDVSLERGLLCLDSLQTLL